MRIIRSSDKTDYYCLYIYHSYSNISECICYYNYYVLIYYVLGWSFDLLEITAVAIFVEY